jgi:hypothetical protein
MSTSATGGYLLATSTNAIEDEDLRVFFQQLVSGVTGMAGNLVRPRWQPEPPNIPSFGSDWAAIGVTKRTRDVNSYNKHTSTSDGHGGLIEKDYVHRTEVLDVLCSFYGPNCEGNSELFAMGLEVGQNREAMQLAGYGLVCVEDATMMADLFNERWVTRIDLPFQIRRAQLYQYSVLDVVAAQATIVEDTGGVGATISVSLKPVFGFNTSSSNVAGFGVGNWGP